MDYTTSNQMQGYANATPPATPTRPLERIGTAADMVMHAAIRLDEFLQRFEPQPMAAAPSNGSAAPVSVSYSSNIERLFANLEALEARVQSIHALG